MYVLEQKFYDFMIEKDVPPEMAKSVAEECARRIQNSALVGTAAGLTVGLLTMNPGTLLMGAATGGLLGTATLIGSPSCQEVRDAAFKLNGLLP